MLENKIFSILFFLTVLLRHGIRHAVRIFYGGCLALLALRACVTQARFASNPYARCHFFCLEKAKNTKSQDFSSLCRRHNFTQKTKFFLHIFTCSQKSCLWRRCISFRLRRRFIPLTLHCTCEVFSHTRVRFVEFFNAHLSVLKRQRLRHFFCLEKGKKHAAIAALHTIVLHS